MFEAMRGQVELLEQESDRAQYAIDGVLPGCVALPVDEAQVAQSLATASRLDWCVSPWGSGTRINLGNRPERVDLALSLERLNQVLEYVPADMTVTVQAGVRLADLRPHLAAHGQMLPLAGPERATVGGLIAVNSQGAMRMAYGGVRDLLLGTRVALSDGRLIKTGGRVVKNVAGYDLNKLLVGSLGTLGVITEATFRLLPIPARQLTVCHAYPSAVTALARAEEILNSELIPVALTLLSPGVASRLDLPGPWTLAIRLAETETNVAYQAGRLAPAARILAGAAEERLWQGVEAHGDNSLVRYRVSTVVEDLARVVQTEGCEAIAHVGTATVLLFKATAAGLTDLNLGLRPVGGWAVLEVAPPLAKVAIDIWGPERPEWRLSRQVKAALDPTRTLNRGRFVGGI